MFRELPIPLAIIVALSSGVANAEGGLTCWTKDGIFSGCISDPVPKTPHLVAGVGDDCANGETVIKCPSHRSVTRYAASPKLAPRCGTLFGHPPNDGRGQPINELFCDIRGWVFMTFIWPRSLETQR